MADEIDEDVVPKGMSFGDFMAVGDFPDTQESLHEKLINPKTAISEATPVNAARVISEEAADLQPVNSQIRFR